MAEPHISPLDIAELLEQILGFTEFDDILRGQRVCHLWNNCIASSIELQRLLWAVSTTSGARKEGSTKASASLMPSPSDRPCFISYRETSSRFLRTPSLAQWQKHCRHDTTGRQFRWPPKMIGLGCHYCSVPCNLSSPEGLHPLLRNMLKNVPTTCVSKSDSSIVIRLNPPNEYPWTYLHINRYFELYRFVLRLGQTLYRCPHVICHQISIPLCERIIIADGRHVTNRKDEAGLQMEVAITELARFCYHALGRVSDEAWERYALHRYLRACQMTYFAPRERDFYFRRVKKEVVKMRTLLWNRFC
jgi:hypothetical protein